ncbi:MAG: prolipoprotein diacylglyceryl transferase, partial [Ilumatobacteraceae bacterium]
MFAAFPSPPANGISLGPIDLRFYGLMIAIGILVAIRILGSRLESRGAGSADDASAIGLGGAVGGLIGARLYHVATEWDRFADDLGAIPAIWKGGLGIPGGIALGVVFGVWTARRRGVGVSSALWAAAPAIPVAQAIGRWGNWFNQELFGR